MNRSLVLLALALSAAPLARGQSADWQNVVWREPQVRYLLADMTLNGGNRSLYRKHAAEAQVLDPFRFQMAIDGSRASWKPE